MNELPSNARRPATALARACCPSVQVPSQDAAQNGLEKQGSNVNGCPSTHRGLLRLRSHTSTRWSSPPLARTFCECVLGACRCERHAGTAAAGECNDQHQRLLAEQCKKRREATTKWRRGPRGATRCACSPLCAEHEHPRQRLCATTLCNGINTAPTTPTWSEGCHSMRMIASVCCLNTRTAAEPL